MKRQRTLKEKLELQYHRLSMKFETIPTGDPEEIPIRKKMDKIRQQLKELEDQNFIKIFGTAEPSTEELERYLGLRK